MVLPHWTPHPFVASCVPASFYPMPGHRVLPSGQLHRCGMKAGRQEDGRKEGRAEGKEGGRKGEIEGRKEEGRKGRRQNEGGERGREEGRLLRRGGSEASGVFPSF